MKEKVVEELKDGLEKLGLVPIIGGDSDLTVDKELLDAKGGSGQKKIRYENAILVDDVENEVHLYEKTTEMSKGFSVGASGETTFQSGKTLMRRVKGTFVGLNGNVVPYDFDIGEISKSVKEIAEKNGYKFRTVLRRKSAQHR